MQGSLEQVVTRAALMLGIVLARRSVLASKSHSYPYDLPTLLGTGLCLGSQPLAEVLCHEPCSCASGTCCAHWESPGFRLHWPLPQTSRGPLRGPGL